MQFYSDLEKRKEIVREFIRKNSYTTTREIKDKLHTKISKLYYGGMEEAYRDAGVVPPRTFRHLSVEEKRNMVVDYIKKHPGVGSHIIRRYTKINLFSVFSNTQEAYKKAGVEYPREERRQLMLRDNDEKRKIIISLIKKNPLLSINEIGRMAKVHPYSLFKNIREIYSIAGIISIGRNKRKLNKQDRVVDYIKNNNFSTQREINIACKTKVQELFDKGIFEAYKKAGVEYPYKRLNIHGAALKLVKDDASKFEEKIAISLSGYGNVNRLVKTKRGFADIILERKGKKAVVEVKNYKSHNISISNIKQLNKYLEDVNSNLGFLICLKKPKKDTFLMGENKIIVLEESELSNIPQIMDL